MSHKGLSSVLLASAATFALPLMAQTAAATGLATSTTTVARADGADDASAEIIVTAQKRSERLNDVPLSITAATGIQLKAQGITSPADLEKIVSGFTYQRSSYGVPVYSIRGIGFLDTALAVAPTVSIYVDQIPLPFSPMAAGTTLDLERVEALKGPQGTLFGQNSTGGAINYIAAKPTQDFKAGVDLGYGRFSSFEGEGFLSGPLTGTLAARLSVRSERSGNWQRDYTRNDSLGARRFTTGRLLLDWNPASNAHFELNLNGWRDTSDTQAAQFLLYAPSVPNGLPEQAAALPLQPVAPASDRAADWDPGVALRRNDWFYQAALRGDINVTDGVTLNTITAYSEYSQDSLNDPDGSNFQDFRINKRGKIKSFSQEVRLSGDTDRLRWMIGGNLEHDVTADRELLLPPYYGSNGSVGPFRFNSFELVNDQKIDTVAGFGSLDVKLTPTLTVQGSARYTDQNRDFAGCVRDAGDGALAAAFNLLHALIGVSGTTAPGGCVTYDNATNAVLPVINKQLHQDNVSWRGSLNWKPTTDILVYGNVTKGYKGGSFATIAAIQSNELNPVTQESVVAYEAGFKVSALHRAVDVSGAVFHYDYSDKQILGFYASPIFGSLPALVNVPKSRVNGAELEWTLRPVKAVRFSGGATYISSKVTSDFITADPFGKPLDIRGEQFPNAPDWQFNGDVQVDVPVSATWSVYVGAGGRYRTRSYAAFGNAPLFSIDAYGTLDLRLGAESADGHYRAELWGRNVTNTYYWNNVSHLVDTVARTAGLPVTYGFRVSYRY